MFAISFLLIVISDELDSTCTRLYARENEGWLKFALQTRDFLQQMGLWFSAATHGMWQQAAQTVGGANLKAPLHKHWAKSMSEDAEC